jgi:hypothetical protein
LEAEGNHKDQKENERSSSDCMGMIQYFEFKGVKYGVGTIVKVPTTKDLRWLPKEQIMQEAVFTGGAQFVFTHLSGSISLYEENFIGKYEQYIEIIKPIYYQNPAPLKPQNIFTQTGSGSWDAHNEVCMGFIWYIAVMLIAIIFKARVGIWILATIVYFLWKAKK